MHTEQRGQTRVKTSRRWRLLYSSVLPVRKRREYFCYCVAVAAMVQYLQPPPPAGNKPGQSSRLCGSAVTLAARLNYFSLRRGRTAAASVFTLWETPAARPRGFLLEQRATSVWDKTFNRRQTAIVIGVTTSSLSTLSLGVFKFQHTHVCWFLEAPIQLLPAPDNTQLWLCRFGSADSDRSQC